jgi:NAD(P)-dependent dehydrogenase (short-subunit alcohol dehydrogenase family)
MTSTSGLVGNIGQANYAAAKMGIVGLTRIVALDMARYNVTANCISPFAWTRMIGTIPQETEVQRARVEKIKRMGPEHIAPLAVFLASEASKEVSGQVLGVRGQEVMVFSQMRPVARVHHDGGFTPEKLAELFAATLGHHLTPLETSGQYFNYDPLV